MYNMIDMIDMDEDPQIKQQLVREIINIIRQDVRAMNQRDPAIEPWDEGESGAGYLDNEIYAFMRLPMATESIRLSWDNIHTVQGFRRALLGESLEFLAHLHRFISAGGTASQEWQELRSELFPDTA